MRTKAILSFVATVAMGLGVACGTANASSGPITDSSTGGARAQAAKLAPGVALQRGRSVKLPRRCGSTSLGVESSLVQVLVTVRGNGRAHKVGLAGSDWAVARHARVTKSVWVHPRHSRVTSCMHGLTARLAVMANLTRRTSRQPGGLVDLTARIPLPTSGERRGSWSLPARSVPQDARGLLMQVWGTSPGSAVVRAGNEHLPIGVGKAQGSVTLTVAHGPLSWRRAAGRGPIRAVLLGYVTAVNDARHGGSTIHRLKRPITSRRATVVVAGRHGIPSYRATAPPTGVLAEVSGDDPATIDPLSGGRRIGTHAVRTSAMETMLRLNNRGALRFTDRARTVVVAYLAGDIVRSANSVNMSLHGEPRLMAKPQHGRLRFRGHHHWTAGTTLIFGAEKFTPRGLIAVVRRSYVRGADSYVSYRIGGLLDAFKELSLTSQIPRAEQKHRHKHGSVRPSDVGIGGSPTLTFGSSKSVSYGPLSGSVGYSFRTALTISINIHTTLGVIPTSISLHYALDSDATLSANVGVSAEWSGDDTIDLGHAVLGGFDLGPVFVVPEMSAAIDLHAQVDAAASLGASITEHTHVGFTLASGHGPASDPNNSMSKPQLNSNASTSLSGQVSAELMLKFDLAIDGLAGPDAVADAKLTLSGALAPSPSWQLRAEGDIGIGFDLNSLDSSVIQKALELFHIPENPTWSLWHLDYVIASSSGSTGGNSGSGGGSGSGGLAPGSGAGITEGAGRVNIMPCLNLRSAPTGSSDLLGCIPGNEMISIDCTSSGATVTGPYGATALWDHTSYGGVSGYVSDAWMYTGTNGAVAPACGGGGGPIGGTSGNGRINISPCLNLRSGPNGGTSLVGCIPYNTMIQIDCTAQGNSVTGPYGASTLWDHTTYAGVAGYVADAWVYTGTSAAIAPTCGGGQTYPTGRIIISPCLNLRAGPNGSTQLIGCVPDGTIISIYCTAQGNPVTGPYGTTTIWDQTSYNGETGYVSDAYVYTGTNGAVAGSC